MIALLAPDVKPSARFRQVDTPPQQALRAIGVFSRSRIRDRSPAGARYVDASDDPAWSYLVSLGLVWVDTATLRPTVGLTSAGRGYTTD